MIFQNITLGSDPELFIINTKTNQVVSSIGLIPGEKGNPWRDEKWMKKGFGMEIDNILAEFNIPPCKTLGSWITNIEFMKNYIRDFVKKIDPCLDIKCSASELVPWDQLNSDEAKLFGCAEDYNVYTESVNPKPKGELTNLRSAGVHIHVGYKNPNIPQSMSLIKYMDVYVGLPSVILDDDNRRRTLYGKAGSFRLCPYGLEYRVLSGKFIDNRQLITFMYESTMNAIDACSEEFPLPDADDVISAINDSNKELAKSIMKKYNIKMSY